MAEPKEMTIFALAWQDKTLTVRLRATSRIRSRASARRLLMWRLWTHRQMIQLIAECKVFFWRGLLSKGARTTLATREDYSRGARNGTSSMTKRHFVNDKVVLWREESGTLTRRKVIFLRTPSFWGIKSSVTSMHKGIVSMRGLAPIPLIAETPYTSASRAFFVQKWGGCYKF